MRTRKSFLASLMLSSLLATAANAESLKIGVLNDQSGVQADFAGTGSVIAARMAVQDFGGTVAGMPVEVVTADHQNKADIGANTARQWFDQDGVDVIVDVPNSAVALAVNAIAKQANKVLLVSGGGTSDLTGKDCSPNTVHWTYDTWGQANTVGTAVTKAGSDSWYLMTVDYSFGYALERDAADAIRKAGGKILGTVRHPLGTSDLSSFLLQAQASGAKVLGLGSAGADTMNAVKQAQEFGIVDGGQRLVAMLMVLNDIAGMGLDAAQGLYLSEAFYWDLNDGTRAWARRFAEANNGRYPNMVHAGVYSSILHYLKAVNEIKGAEDGLKVVEAMKAKPTDDALFGQGSIRKDGRKIHDMYLFQVKTPDESKGPYDFYKLVGTVPAESAFHPLESSACPLVK